MEMMERASADPFFERAELMHGLIGLTQMSEMRANIPHVFEPGADNSSSRLPARMWTLYYYPATSCFPDKILSADECKEGR